MATCVAGRDGSRQGQRIAEAGLIRYGSVLSPAALAGGRKAAESSFKLQVITDACIPHPSALTAAPKSWYRTVPGIGFGSCVRVSTYMYLSRVSASCDCLVSSHIPVSGTHQAGRTQNKEHGMRELSDCLISEPTPLPSHSGCSLPSLQKWDRRGALL